MTDQALTQEYIRTMVRTNYKWTMKAIVAIYERQTDDEQATGETKHENTIGFNGPDAAFLSSLAVQIKYGSTLSARQLEIAQRLMPKYSRQLLEIAKAKAS